LRIFFKRELLKPRCPVLAMVTKRESLARLHIGGIEQLTDVTRFENRHWTYWSWSSVKLRLDNNDIERPCRLTVLARFRLHGTSSFELSNEKIARFLEFEYWVPTFGFRALYFI